MSTNSNPRSSKSGRSKSPVSKETTTDSNSQDGKSARAATSSDVRRPGADVAPTQSGIAHTGARNELAASAPESVRSLFERGGVSPERLRRIAERGVAVYGRVSSQVQAATSKGSLLAQGDYWRSCLQALGIPTSVAAVFEAWGESASGKKPRWWFRKLLRLLRDGKVGLIIVPEHHRLSRNTVDTHTILREAATVGALIVINGLAYDPADPNQLLVLHILSAVSEHAVSASADWSLKNRFALARRAGLRCNLPSGLVWASPTDHTYVSRLHAAGLSHWLEELWRIPVDRRAVSIGRDGTRYYVLPYPDISVFTTVELRLQWLLETRSVSEVRARIIAGHAGWPSDYAGLVPTIRLTRYRPDLVPRWEPPETTHLTRWFENPALYGIYAFYAAKLAPAELRAERRRRTNGVHYGRAVAERLPALPDALTLLLQ